MMMMMTIVALVFQFADEEGGREGGREGGGSAGFSRIPPPGGTGSKHESWPAASFRPVSTQRPFFLISTFIIIVITIIIVTVMA